MKNIFKRNKKTNLFIFCIFLIVSLVLELTIFNYKHYESLFFGKNIKPINIIYKNFNETNDNRYEIIVDEDLSPDKDYFDDIKASYIDMIGINSKVNNIYLDIEHERPFISYMIYYTDESNKLLKRTVFRDYNSNVEQSKYIKVNLNGEAKSIRIVFFDNMHGVKDFESKRNIIKVNNIEFNKKVPFNFSIIRILFIFLVLSFIYIIRPKSKIYDIKLFSKEDGNKNKILISTFVILQIIIYVLLINSNKMWINNNELVQKQYNLLAHSLKSGKTNIDYEVDKKLISMSNPYDTNLRVKTFGGYRNNKVLWDYAYYKGKYYVYFGIVPEIISYLPIYSLFKLDLKNYVYILTSLIVITFVVYKLFKYISQKYFKNISTMQYILMCSLLLDSPYLLYVVKRPDVYFVPIISGVMFSLIGIYLWFNSIEEDKINNTKLILGSICMALVFGCRPQIGLTSLFSIIIFKDFVKNKKIDTKNILSFTLPYIIIGILLMIYNYVRFESIFNFGANYNLTTNDMTLRGFRIERIFSGIYYFLLSPTTFSFKYPFIVPQVVETNYIGVSISENMFGGILYTNVILVFGFLLFKLKKLINNKMLYNFSLISLIIGIILIIVDVQGAGILPRYMVDFSWLLFIPTIIVLLSIFNNSELNKKYYKYILVLIIFSFIFSLLLIPVDVDTTIIYDNANLYFKLQYLIQFWL